MAEVKVVTPRVRHLTRNLVLASLISLLPALGMAGGQFAIIANRASQYNQLHAHGVTVAATITECPSQVDHNNDTNSNTDITWCNAEFLLRGSIYQETILGVSSAVPTPEKTTLMVDPTNPSVNYLASDVKNGSGTGAGSFFTSILGIFALIWMVLWLLFTVPAWRRWYRKRSAAPPA
jgi:hypothetical protein